MSTNGIDKERNNELWRRVGVVTAVGSFVLNVVRVFTRN